MQGDRPRGLHQPRHRRRGAGGAAARAGAACAADRGARQQRIGADRRARARHGRALRAGRGHRAGPGGRARRWASCAISCSSACTSVRRCGPSTRRSPGSCGRLFEHYVEHPELLPAARCEPTPSSIRRRARVLAGRARPGTAGDRLPCGDDRPLLHQGVHRARGAAGLRPLALAAMALYTNESKDRVRDAVDFVELVSARTELRRAGPARYEGLCPFHDERTPSFGIDPDPEGLPLLRLPGLRRRVHVRAGDRGRGLQGGARAAGRTLRGGARARAGGPARGRAPPPPRAAARAARPHDRLLRALPVGVRQRPGGPASTWPGRGLGEEILQRVPGRLRAQRLGPGAAGLAHGRVLRAGAVCDGAGAALQAERPAL